MAQFVLEILDGDRAGDVVTLSERPLRIGRKAGNDLVLHDEKASGVHAEVVFEGDRYVLRDLGSTNGTLMDGRKVTEVVLGGGDTFAIGRVRMRFRGDGDAAETEGFAVERIDAARLQAARSKSRPVGLMVAVLVAVVGAGGYLWWSRRAGDDGAGHAAATRLQPELRVAGNKLEQSVANCESETGWELRLAGAGFAGSTTAHTGRGALEAVRSGDGADFAVAATSEEVRVLAGRSLRAVAYLHTDSGARAAVRLSFWSSQETIPFRFRTGTALAACDGWQQAEVTAAVPVGADRCRLEIVALLPQEGSAVQCDDVALCEQGDAAPIQHKVGETATVLGTGQSVVIRSMDPDEPATLLALLPGSGSVGAELQGLRAADQLVLSDLGASVSVQGDDRSAVLTVAGCDSTELQFPADSASGLLVRDQDGFAGVEANSTFTAQEVLLGDRSTRCLVALGQPVQVQGSTQGGVYRLQVPAAEVRFALGFRQERQRAGELLRKADELEQRGEPGQALDTLRELLATVPHDAETLARVLARRAEWQEVLSARLRELAVDLDEAAFFDTRGGFERVVTELDKLTQSYGASNIEDPTAIAAMRKQAADRLTELDEARAQQRRQRLDTLAQAFDDAQQPDLAKLVRDYLK